MPDARFWDRLSSVFVREDNGYVRFRRPALQEVAYSSLPFKLRRRLHEAVGLSAELEHGTRPRRRPGGAVEPLRAGRRLCSRPSVRDARRETRDRPVLPRGRRTAVPARDRAGPGVRMAADAQALADAWEQMGDALR